MLELWWC